MNGNASGILSFPSTMYVGSCSSTTPTPLPNDLTVVLRLRWLWIVGAVVIVIKLLADSGLERIDVAMVDALWV